MILMVAPLLIENSLAIEFTASWAVEPEFKIRLESEKLLLLAVSWPPEKTGGCCRRRWKRKCRRWRSNRRRY